MPSAGGGKNEYYSRHQHHSSSQSQTSLPDQLGHRDNNVYSQTAPTPPTYLPGTVFTQLRPQHSRNSSLVSQRPALNTAAMGHAGSGQAQPNSPNPDDFYRHHHYQHQRPYDQYVMSATPSSTLPHNNTRTIDLHDRVEENREHNEASFSSNMPGRRESQTISGVESRSSTDMPRSATTLPGLRARKASVKNLVEQFNSSAEDLAPPIPPKSFSGADSRTMSPMLSPNTIFTPSSGTKKQSVPLVARHSILASPQGLDLSQTMVDSDRSEHTSYNPNPPTRRPLFGEILNNALETPRSGYGVLGPHLNPRRRSGSESSPLHSPNAMFAPAEPDAAREVAFSTAPVQDTETYFLSPSIFDGANTASSSAHQRTNSEFSSLATRASNEARSSRPSAVSPTPENRSSHSSRIPVSDRDSSLHTSDSSRPLSDTEQRTPRKNNQYPARKVSNTTHRTSPRRKPRSPSKISSPGRRGKSASALQGQKSPSLRAKIIAPPPKISPPLRSSRPRVPLSSASTAASRAKMAEKFNAMQRLNSDKRFGGSKAMRPPELTDVDLKERRLRITQALSRSRDGADLRADIAALRRRGLARSLTSSPALSEGNSPSTEIDRSYDSVPAVVIEHASDGNNEAFLTTPTDDRQDHRDATHNALQAMDEDGAKEFGGPDSPAFGQIPRSRDSRPSPLTTHFLQTRENLEPASAVTDMTAASGATMIDPEPQADLPHGKPPEDSLLGHVLELRDTGQRSEYAGSVRSGGGTSDHADDESIRLLLQHTAYLREDSAGDASYQARSTDDLSHNLQVGRASVRDSWTSSILDDGEKAQGSEVEFQLVDEAHHTRSSDPRFITAYEEPPTPSDQQDTSEDAITSVRDSDAYTIVNIVLQQHSTSGVVDQQFVDDVYQRLIDESPDLRDDGSMDVGRIEQLCLREIRHREKSWYNPITPEDNDDDPFANARPEGYESNEPATASSSSTRPDQADSDSASLKVPRPPFRRHSHRSSLDSAEDWANTSPSIGDWMRYADEDKRPGKSKEIVESVSTSEGTKSPITPTAQNKTPQRSPGRPVTPSTARPQPNVSESSPEEYGTAIIRQAFALPQPPPKDNVPHMHRPESPTVGRRGSLRQAPAVPSRVGSLSQPHAPASRTANRSEVTPWEVQEPPFESVNPNLRPLKQRRNVLKELVDTEFTYERDLRVLCDIYKQTAPAALTEEDTRTLFGNVDQVQNFARGFLVVLKQSGRPAYVMERPERRSQKKDDVPRVMTNHTNSSTSTLASVKNAELDVPDASKDRETRIGDAFENSLADMEQVYTEYIRNQHAANQKLASVQNTPGVREWLKECRDNSSDITNAWNLDALLVKPVQRITKYPLLLKELVNFTPDTHPDLPALRRALSRIKEVNVRINDVKKHAELVDSVLNRKRGQSDVRGGFSKAFGRRAEKLKQHVGMADMYEDNEYNDVRIAYDNNIVQLLVVANDCQSYEKGVTQWLNKIVEIAESAEAWVEVGHSHHAQAESKLRQMAMMIRGLSMLVLPDHLESLHKRVVLPMQKTIDLLNRFKDDPKGLLQKRDKRMIDYAQLKNKKDKGEKIDRKTAERMEQWEALNLEAKERMRKLLRSTTTLVQTCLHNFVELQMSWISVVQQKFSTTMGIPLEHLGVHEIVKDWQVDFDYQEASALSLGICNGSLLTDAANMINLLHPGVSMNGDDSPRQASYSSMNKRSGSLTSDGSHALHLEPTGYTSGSFSRVSSDTYAGGQYSTTSSSARTRAASTVSGATPRTSEPSTKSTKHSSASASFARPMTDASIPHDSFVAPRTSTDLASPTSYTHQPQRTPDRPPSSSTFFSATAGPSQPQSSHLSISSSIFSSAMPMSDSPTVERRSQDFPDREPDVLFTAASVYEFNIDRSRREAGFPYLTYVSGEIFDIIGERGELWLARNQDDPHRQVGWIWNKHFAKLAE